MQISPGKNQISAGLRFIEKISAGLRFIEKCPNIKVSKIIADTKWIS
jgi:hypothetical protein